MSTNSSCNRPDAKADKYFKESIIIYGNNIPIQILHNALTVKLNLEEYEEAEAIFIAVRTLFRDDIPAATFAAAASAKVGLEKYEEAYELYTKAIKAYGADVPTQVLNDAEQVKLHLKANEAKRN